MDHVRYIWRALKDGRPISTLQLCLISCLGVFGLGVNYVIPIYDEAIYDYWPKLGIALSIIISIFCLLTIPFGRREDLSVHHTRLSLCLMLFALSIRQYEENIFDCLQQQGSFIPFANKVVDTWLPAFHCHDFQECVFNKSNNMAYNTAGLWPLFMLMPFFYQTTPLFAVCACGVAIVSSMGHFASCVIMLSYSPGSASALVLLCPSAAYAATLVCNNNFAGHPSVHVASLAAAGFCHAGVAFTFFLSSILKLLPNCFFPFFMYAIFTIDLGIVCRLFGGPTERFIARKTKEVDERRKAGLRRRAIEDNDEDEAANLL